jgi:hypothetical protein
MATTIALEIAQAYNRDASEGVRGVMKHGGTLPGNNY